MVRLPIPYGRHFVDESDIKAVEETLKSDWITTGPKIEEFEKALCDYTGAKYCVAVSSATAGLHLSYLAIKILNGLSDGFPFFTSPITFLATSNSAVYVNAKIDFVDIDPETGLMNFDELSGKVSDGSIVAVVDYAGQPPDLEKFYHLVKSKKSFLVEDAAHSIGADYTDSSGRAFKVGSPVYADAVVFSFHAVKNITTGEGGAVLTNNGELARLVRLMRSHGVERDPDKMENYCGGWFYEMQTIGFNYRITDFQCALGISQLNKLDSFVKRRREIAGIYDTAFEEIEEVEPLKKLPFSNSSYHLYVVKFKGVDRKFVYDFLRKNGILAQVHYIPVHIQPFYRRTFGFKKGDFPRAESFYESVLTLPSFPAMNDDEVNYVIDKVKEAVWHWKKN